MNAWKTMLVYTLLAMVAAPMFAPATNKAPQMVFHFVEENNMFKVKTAENAKQLPNSVFRRINPATGVPYRVHGY